MTPCFECGAPSDHDHHVVPRVLGGTKTVPLCERCHAKVHDREYMATGALTSAAMQHMRARGEYTGGRPPLGFELGDDGQLIRVETEQHAVVLARQLRENGLTLRAVAAELAAHGFVNRRGRVFDSKQVARMVRPVRK